MADAERVRTDEQREEVLSEEDAFWGSLSYKELQFVKESKARAVAEEREACAKEVEAWHEDPENAHDGWEWCSCEGQAAAIRARGK